MRITREQATEKYGEIKDREWGRAGFWCIMHPIPESISKAWINSGTGQPWLRRLMRRLRWLRRGGT